MRRVVVYATNYCPFCTRAKALLRAKNINFEEVDITNDEVKREEAQKLSGRKTVPQIFIDGTPVGGFEELKNLDETGELDRLLNLSQ
jgi:glutaredoxin 3